MQKITTHSKSGLFLMEMIFVLLFLGLTCGICVRLFAASYLARNKAAEYNHIQELTTSAGEILEGTAGTPDSFLKFMPNGVLTGNTIEYFFDKNWETADSSHAIYKMSVTLSCQDSVKTAILNFTKIASEQEEDLYDLTICYPAISPKEDTP